MENKLPWYTISVGQSTHQDLDKKSGLPRILFEKSCLRHNLFHKNLACGACFSWEIVSLIILECIWFEVLYSVYQFIGSENDSSEAFKRSASADLIWVTWHYRDNGEQIIWKKQSLPQRYVCVGCQLNSDQALRSLCLKGHVRARDSTLWRYRWQEASEFFRAKILLWRELSNRKISKKNRNALSDALLMTRFQYFAADTAPGKSTLGAVFCNHASRDFH